MRNILLTKI